VKNPYTVIQKEMQKINIPFVIQMMLEGTVPNLQGTLERELKP
jgi:hypothetical protein